MPKAASAQLQQLPPTQRRRHPDDPVLLRKTFQTVLRGQLRHQAPLPWVNAQELANFLGPRPEQAKVYVQRHNPNLPHSTFNTCWTGQPDSDRNKAQRKEQSKALKKARKAPAKPSKPEINTNPKYTPKNSPETLEQIDQQQVSLLRRAINPCKPKQKRRSEP